MGCSKKDGLHAPKQGLRMSKCGVALRRVSDVWAQFFLIQIR